jgi:hypothetical protein
MVHTKKLADTQSLVLNNDDLVDLTIIVQTGTCNLTGNGSYKGAASDVITLPTGTIMQLKKICQENESLTIAAVGGNTDVIIEY